ncbi:MAG: DnaJ domain [Verrucomicrobiota bacterium]|jgi:curved DNA-binding protein CbpA
MTDCFALLGQPRLPHLDQDAIQQAFRERARLLHPDANSTAASEAFTELNNALGVLRDPRLRLQHLLALENSEPPTEALGSEVADLFSRAAEIAQRAKQDTRSARGSESAITQSMRQVKRREISEQLGSFLQELESNELTAQCDLARLNQKWNNNRDAAIAEAKRLQQRFTFIQRWLETLRELQFQLQH